MRALSAAELLLVWEHTQAQRPAQQALTLLSAACPELPPEQIAALSIGRRDAALLTLREWTFGSELVSVASCPVCAERLELAFRVDDIRVAEPPADAPLLVTLDERAIRFRLPTGADLIALATHGDVHAPRRWLLQRCVLPSTDEAEPPIELWPPEIEAAIVAQMAQADPQADIQLALNCPACEHGWQATFDIVSFFWAEIDAWAYQVLRDVHALASAYGWREQDILALSPWRRQRYLEMVGR